MSDSKKPLITKEQLEEARHKGCSVYGYFKAFCDLNECCEHCNKRVKLICKIKSWLEEMQTRIILKACKPAKETAHED